MADRRSFLRSTDGKEEFAEILWTHRAIETSEGALGTPGICREQVFGSASEVEEAVRLETQRLIGQGFTEHKSKNPLRIDPAQYVASLCEQSHLRNCAVPVFSRTPGTKNGSRRGGVPFLAADESWPSCASCHKPLRFLLQVALGELTGVLGSLPQKGLLQLFVCDSDCYFDKGWEPFSGTILIRTIDGQEGKLAALPKCAASDADFLVPENRIETWQTYKDSPDSDTLTALTGTDSDTALEAWELLTEKGLANRWEKVGGWPAWAQSAVTVDCPKCTNSPMMYAMQLEDTLQELDVLCGNSLYVLCCPKCGLLTTVQQR